MGGTGLEPATPSVSYAWDYQPKILEKPRKYGHFVI